MLGLKSHKIIVITGPTAIGKTQLAMDLVSELDAFIISADSRQVYKELTIGTAKPTEKEIAIGKMELVNHISIKDYYSAGLYMREALSLIEIAQAEKKIPIVCGGTGLYIKAICEGLDLIPNVDQITIESLNSELEVKGLEILQQELLSHDPSYYATIEKDNPRRIIRALSVIRQTGKPFSSFLSTEKSSRDFDVINVVLELPREELYSRINSRVLRMVNDGLVEEVESLTKYRDLQALQTVGYKEVFKYIDDEWSLEQAVAEIQKNTRRYAKRQMTWNRNQLIAQYFHPQKKSEIWAYIKSQIK